MAVKYDSSKYDFSKVLEMILNHSKTYYIAYKLDIPMYIVSSWKTTHKHLWEQQLKDKVMRECGVK